MFKYITRLIELWLKQRRCKHKWLIFMEHYPRYAQDYWKCEKCNKYRIFDWNEIPFKRKLAVCNLRHIHTID